MTAEESQETGQTRERSATSSQAAPRLGVLFVHGIGSQSEGETLAHFGDPVCEWLDRWAGGAPNRQAGAEEPLRLSYGSAQGSAQEDDSPRHVLLDLELPPVASASRKSQWLLAESWWSNAFLQPRFSDLARWTLLILPWTIVSHFGKRYLELKKVLSTVAPGRKKEGLPPPTELSDALSPRRLVERLKAGLMLLGRVDLTAKRVWSVLVMILGVALVPLTMLAMIVLLALRMLPVPKIRSFVTWSQRVLAASIGDSFVLLSSRIQRASILAKFRRDLDWLATRCQRVVVVAHSQGAAIAHEVLREDVPENLHRFLTLGSGLGKLAQVRRLSQAGRRRPGGGSDSLVEKLAPLTALAGVGLLTLSYMTWIGWREWGHVVGLYMAFLGVALVSLGAKASTGRLRPRIEDLRLDRPVRWVDFYTPEDPVSNGDLLTAETWSRRREWVRQYRSSGKSDGKPVQEPTGDEPYQEVGVASRVVHNRGSLLNDHTSYWDNLDGFVGLVVHELATAAGVEISADDRSRVEVAVEKRARRVSQLRLARLLLLVFAGLASWATFSSAAVRDSLQWTVTPGLWLLDVAIASVSALPGIETTDRARDLAGASAAVAVAVILLSTWLTYLALLAVWATWTKRETDTLFNQRKPGRMSLHQVAFWLPLLGLLAAAAATALTGS